MTPILPDIVTSAAETATPWEPGAVDQVTMLLCAMTPEGELALRHSPLWRAALPLAAETTSDPLGASVVRRSWRRRVGATLLAIEHLALCQPASGPDHGPIADAEGETVFLRRLRLHPLTGPHGKDGAADSRAVTGQILALGCPLLPLPQIEDDPAALDQVAETEPLATLFFGASPLRPMPPGKTPAMQAAWEFLWASAQHWLRHQAAINHGGRLEGVHQARVGLRRLRTGLALFAPVLGRSPVLEDLAAEAGRQSRDLAAILGQVRDWDVFQAETLPRFLKGAALQAGQGQLVEAASLLRAQAEQRMNHALWHGQALATHAAVAHLCHALHGHVDAAGAELSLRKLAKRQLERRWRRMRQAARLAFASPADAGDEPIHELRKEIKKLRYTIDYFGYLFDFDGAQAYRRPLTGLQDHLGVYNDSLVVGGLSEQLRRQSPGLDADAAYALGWVEASIAHHLPESRDEAHRAWAALERIPPFWD